MVLCWGEGHGSSIHDHANSHCFMKILAGNLCEIRYEWPQHESSINDEENSQNCTRGMEEKGRSILRTDQVCYINGKSYRLVIRLCAKSYIVTNLQ